MPTNFLKQAIATSEPLKRHQANLMAASAILAGLKLEEDVIYRSIQRERTREIALKLLRSGVEIDIIASSTGLSIEEIQQLLQQVNESA